MHPATGKSAASSLHTASPWASALLREGSSRDAGAYARGALCSLSQFVSPDTPHACALLCKWHWWNAKLEVSWGGTAQGLQS